MHAYTLQQAQDFVREAVERSKNRHARWRVLEALYATGDIDEAQLVAKDAGKLYDLTRGLDQETINLVKPHIDVIIASVIAHDPRHLAVPYGGGQVAEEGAKLAEAVLRYWWVRARATQDAKDATWDMVVTGNGFIKVGWQHLEAPQDLEPHELEEQLTDLMEADRLDAELSGRPPSSTDDLVDALEPTSALVEVDEPFIEYVSPYDIFVPANARRMWETRWVAHRVTLPMDELKENDAFDAEARERLVPDGTSANDYSAEWKRQQEDARGVHANTEAFETATIFEFYDMRSRRLMVFQIDSAEPLYDDELPYAHRYPPFAHLRNYSRNGNEFWAFGDLENVASIQHMLNEFFTEQVENARRAGNKYLVDDEAWTPELKAALESDTPDVVAKVKTGGVPIEQVIQSVERKALSGDVYAVKAELEDGLRKVLGINDFQAGGVGADRMSATAAAVVDGVASLRQQEKIAQVEEGVAQVGTLLLLLCQEFMDQPTAIRIAGQGGAIWENIDASLIRGEYIVSVEGGSTQAVNPATREQKGMRTLTQVMPLLTEYGYDPTPALRMGLRDLGYDPDQILAELPAPPAEELPPGAEGGEIPPDAPAAGVIEAGGPPTAAQAQVAGDIAL